MLDVEPDVRVQKIVKEPKLSLKRFSQYVVATENGKIRILKGCKYPNDYVPKFYEMARKLVCDIFSANFEEPELYFEEFKKQATVYRNEATTFPAEKGAHKNRICSAKGLDAIVAMAVHLTPLLKRFTLNSNLKNKRNSITKNGVRVGAMADMLLSEGVGATQVGFLKFNFTTKRLKEDEVRSTLFVLKTFFEKQGVKLDFKSCFLVDVFAWRIYSASNLSDIENTVEKATLEIKGNWDAI